MNADHLMDSDKEDNEQPSEEYDRIDIQMNTMKRTDVSVFDFFLL